MALDHTTRARVRDTLAGLYDDAAKARRIAADAGLDRASINFSGAARELWDAVLDEATRHDRLVTLLACARGEYPARVELAELLGAVGGEVAPGPCVSARDVGLAERQALVHALVASGAGVGAVKKRAKAVGLTPPDGVLRDEGSAWVWLVRELRLRGLDVAPLFVMAGMDVPAERAG